MQRSAKRCDADPGAPTAGLFPFEVPGLQRSRFVLRCARDTRGRPELLRQLGNQLVHLGLGPGVDGAASHTALRSEHHCKLGDVIPIRSIDDRNDIVLAGGEVDFLDLDSYLLGKLTRGLSALGSSLDVANALLGPRQRHYQHRHLILLRFAYSGSGMNSLSSPGTVSKRASFQSAFACSMRSLREDTKFHQMWRGPSMAAPPRRTR